MAARSIPEGRAAPKSIILVVDDVSADRELAEKLLVELGFDVRHARDGVEALEAIASEEPDLVLVDIEMPRMDGLTLCERVKSDPQRRVIPVVLMTGAADRETRVRSLAAGADDFLRKPLDGEELRVRTSVLLRERALKKELDAAESLILALARAVEARDRYTEHHAERVGRYSREVGRVYGLREDELDVLYIGGVLHDLGKIAIPTEILLKPGALSDAERAIIQTHSAEGERICLPLRRMVRFLPIIRHHHERLDGSGYPDHLVGTQIPLHARIAAVADAWDALVSERPYRAGMDRELALGTISSGAGKLFDARCVDIFLELLDRGVIDRIAAEAPLDVVHSSSGG